MQWLSKVVDEVVSRHPKGEIIVESGISPSGKYHMGYLREILTCDAILLELRRRGRTARHIHFVDDQDGFRKVPVGLPAEYEKYLGQPLHLMPSPDGSSQSYADYSLRPFLKSVEVLGVEMEIIRSHQKYQEGFFAAAIEKALAEADQVRQILESISGHKLGEEWSPIQVNEDGYLKKRRFLSIDTAGTTITYENVDGKPQTVSYAKGDVKLDWRIDWPARWWLLNVNVEPFGRDHATKGGSYDTGKALMERVFKAPPPLPVPYNFINRVGEAKKMSASAGTGIEISEVVAVLPPEIVRYFVFRSAPDKLLFFDPLHVSQLIDEFAELLAKENKTEEERRLIDLSTKGIDSTVSNIPFSHLVASHQAALRDPQKTLETIGRTEHKERMEKQKDVILAELKFIDQWLQKWAPEDVKFDLQRNLVRVSNFSEGEKKYLRALSSKIAGAPESADGEWFHKAVYDLKDEFGLSPRQAFESIYKITINKTSGPRAGWFLSILPRDWLIKRLKFEE